MERTDVTAPVQQALNKSQSFLNQQADAVSSMLGSRLDEVASSLRKVASQLRADSSTPMVASLADQGADAVARMGSYFRDADGQRLIYDAEALSRKNPVLSASLAYLAGLSVSRFLKTSSMNARYDESSYRGYAEPPAPVTYGGPADGR